MRSGVSLSAWGLVLCIDTLRAEEEKSSGFCRSLLWQRSMAQANQVKHYSQHFQETVSIRRAGDRSAVAEDLAKYQSATSWPSSEQALPAELQRALQRRKWLSLEVRACWLFLVVCFLGLVASLFGGPFLFKRLPIPDFPAKAPLLTGASAVVFFLAFWVSLSVLSRITDSERPHLEALHFMYLYDNLPRTAELSASSQSTDRDSVFELKLAGRVYEVFSNGETDVHDDDSTLDV